MAWRPTSFRRAGGGTRAAGEHGRDGTEYRQAAEAKTARPRMTTGHFTRLFFRSPIALFYALAAIVLSVATIIVFGISLRMVAAALASLLLLALLEYPDPPLPAAQPDLLPPPADARGSGGISIMSTTCRPPRPAA